MTMLGFKRDSGRFFALDGVTVLDRVKTAWRAF